MPRANTSTILLISVLLMVAIGAAFVWFFSRPKDDAPMVTIAETSFSMGSEEGQPDEQPVHEVEVAAFEIDAREVTVDQYLRCVDSGACNVPAEFHNWCNLEREASLDEPMNCVNHSEAVAYCAWAGKRLPTEVEWELAARGHEPQAYPWGPDAPKGRACYDRKRANSRTCAVGSHPTDTSPFGVQDLAGNVAEWTSTQYCLYDGSGCKPDTFVTRGGSWDMEHPLQARTTFRDFVPAAGRGYNLGFRCARSP